MKYSGIDLHLNNCMVAVIDEQDRMVYRKRLANDRVQSSRMHLPEEYCD